MTSDSIKVNDVLKSIQKYNNNKKAEKKQHIVFKRKLIIKNLNKNIKKNFFYFPFRHKNIPDLKDFI